VRLDNLSIGLVSGAGKRISSPRYASFQARRGGVRTNYSVFVVAVWSRCLGVRCLQLRKLPWEVTIPADELRDTFIAVIGLIEPGP